MATGSITSLGLGSGLDLQDILDQLKAADETTITAKENEIVALQAEVDAYNTVNAKIFNIKSDALNLSLQSNFLENSVSVSDEDILSAIVGDGYSESSYTIDVTQKAQRNSWESAAVSSRTSTLFAEPTSGIPDHDTTAAISSNETLSLYYGTYSGISTDNAIAAGTTDASFAINGVNIGPVVVLEDDSNEALITAINDLTGDHGVTASVDEDGILTLTSADHSEITVTMDSNTQTVFGGGAMTNTGQEQIDISLTAGMTLADIVDTINDDTGNDDGDGTQLITASFTLGDDGDYFIRLAATSGGNSADSEISVSGFDWIGADTTVAITQDASTMYLSVPPGTTYEGMATLINSSDNNPGLTAAIIDNGDADAPYQLSLTSNDTGEDARLTLENFGAMTEVTGAGAGTLNAEFTVDGISYSRQSNLGITDVVSGVTLDLKSTGESTLNIEVNHESVKDDILSMIDGFNELISYITTAETSTDEESEEETTNVLDGSTSANRIVNSLQSLLSTILDLDTAYTSLADIGLDISRDGTVTIDEDTLDAAIASNPDDLKALFLGDDEEEVTGLADLINDALTEMASTTGIASTEIDEAEAKISRLDLDIETQTERLTKRYETLTAEFARLDTYISELNSQSNALESLITAYSSSDS